MTRRAKQWEWGICCHQEPTLKRLSWRTRLMAASSPVGEILVWNTTPKELLPTILHCVYCISFVSPVKPSWTFSRMTSILQNHDVSIRDSTIPISPLKSGVQNLPPMRRLVNTPGRFCDMTKIQNGQHNLFREGGGLSGIWRTAVEQWRTEWNQPVR